VLGATVLGGESGRVTEFGAVGRYEDDVRARDKICGSANRASTEFAKKQYEQETEAAMGEQQAEMRKSPGGAPQKGHFRGGR
jgi:hypothetical protein